MFFQLFFLLRIHKQITHLVFQGKQRPYNTPENQMSGLGLHCLIQKYQLQYFFLLKVNAMDKEIYAHGTLNI